MKTLDTSSPFPDLTGTGALGFPPEDGTPSFASALPVFSRGDVSDDLLPAEPDGAAAVRGATPSRSGQVLAGRRLMPDDPATGGTNTSSSTPKKRSPSGSKKGPSTAPRDKKDTQSSSGSSGYTTKKDNVVAGGSTKSTRPSKKNTVTSGTVTDGGGTGKSGGSKTPVDSGSDTDSSQGGETASGGASGARDDRTPKDGGSGTSDAGPGDVAPAKPKSKTGPDSPKTDEGTDTVPKLKDPSKGDEPKRPPATGTKPAGSPADKEPEPPDLPGSGDDPGGPGSSDDDPSVPSPPTVPDIHDDASLPPQDDDIPAAGVPGDTPFEPPAAGPSGDDADGGVNDTPTAGFPASASEPLTDAGRSDLNNDHGIAKKLFDIFRKVGDSLRQLFSGSSDDTAVDEPAAGADLPVFLPPRDPDQADGDSSGSFQAGYISQLDLENALGRPSWTMCCAASFLYAVQARYPGIDRQDLIDAAAAAADKPLADGSGPCVSDDGYVQSVHQYSQALSQNLGLDDYVDASGFFDSVDDARDAGADVMKVKLSGTIGGDAQEHHVLKVRDDEIDPVPGAGIDDIWDKDSRKVDSVMALDWYPLP